MPSSSLRRVSPFAPVMQQSFPPSYRPDDVLIGPLSIQAIGAELTGMGASNAASGTYPAADRALAYQFCTCDTILVRKLWWMNGTTVGTDTVQVGVYSEAGTTKIISGTAATTAGANLVQEDDITDVELPGGRYWLVIVQNGVTSTPMSYATPAAIMRSIGCAQMAAARPLPATFSPAAVAGAVFPHFGLAGRTQVA